MTELIKALQLQDPGSELIYLYDLIYATAEGSPDSVAYFFPGGLDSDLTEIQFRDSGGTARTYVALPVEMDDLEIQADGALGRPTLKMANILSVFKNAIGGMDYEDLIGKKITRRCTLKKYLVGESGDSNPPVEFPKQSYYIDRIKSKNKLQVEFELAAPYDLAGIQLPRRIIVGNTCPWRYTGAAHDIDEDKKRGACWWRRDRNLLYTNGVKYECFVNVEDEYVLSASSDAITNATTAAGTYTQDTIYKTTGTEIKINADGSRTSGTGVVNYWQCVLSGSVTPSDSSSSWRRIRIYYTYSTSGNYNAYVDTAQNAYVKKDGVLWQVRRTSQASGAHNTVEEGLYWTSGDQCGKKVTSCALRYLAKPLANDAFSVKRETAKSLPFGGFPGSVKKR